MVWAQAGGPPLLLAAGAAAAEACQQRVGGPPGAAVAVAGQLAPGLLRVSCQLRATRPQPALSAPPPVMQAAAHSAAQAVVKAQLTQSLGWHAPLTACAGRTRPWVAAQQALPLQPAPPAALAVLCSPLQLVLATSLHLLPAPMLQVLERLVLPLLPPAWQAALLQAVGGRMERHGQPSRQQLGLRLPLCQATRRDDLLPLLWACFLCCQRWRRCCCGCQADAEVGDAQQQLVIRLGGQQQLLWACCLCCQRWQRCHSGPQRCPHTAACLQPLWATQLAVLRAHCLWQQ